MSIKLIEIKNIRKEKFNGTVYDIEVEEDHSYCIEGICVHNSACTTKVKTGFARGTVSCLLECTEIAQKPLISDGGIREVGDIAKAIACGATMVMCGVFMSGFDQNSGRIIQINEEKKYLYYGSASFNIKGNNDHIEGTEKLLNYKGNMDNHIYDIECSLKSAISYAGKKNIEDLYGTPIFYMEN